MAHITDSRWSWRKLVSAGIMVASLVFSVSAKLVTIPLSLLLACAIFVLWLLFLCYYWYAIVVPTFVKQEKSDGNDTKAKESKTKEKDGSFAESASTTPSWINKAKTQSDNSKDKRLPVTLVTGFLGSGKTTLVKKILTNTVGMKGRY